MGVRGLRSFIRDKRDIVFINFKLQDTKLIIDGSNLLYFLHLHYEGESVYCCNYDHFYKKCTEFFKTLLKCNITPIVVFDGADDPDNMKLGTILKRLDNHFQKVNKWEKTEELLPILSKITLFQVLLELNVAHIACVYEADRDIAVLANKFECPVVSDDSDFYVYNLNRGSISMACLVESERTDREGKFFLPVKLFSRRLVLKEVFKMENDEHIFPVFATLVGNDYFDSSNITLISPKNPRDKLDCATRNLSGIVAWICRAEFGSGEKALAHISGQMSHQERKQFKTVVESYVDIDKFSLFDLEAILNNKQKVNMLRSGEDTNAIECMTANKQDMLEVNSTRQCMTATRWESLDNNIHNTGMTLKQPEQLDGSGTSECVVKERIHITRGTSDAEQMELRDRNRHQLPTWFIRSALQCNMDCPFILNITQNHRLIFKAQAEMHELPSSYKCSENIRRVIYRLVLTPNKRIKCEQQKQVVQEYHRRSTDRSKVKPIARLTGISELPCRETIPLLPERERKAILYATFGVRPTQLEEGMDETSNVLILVLSLWKANSSNATEITLNVLIIGFIAMHIFIPACPPQCQDILDAIEAAGRDKIDVFKNRMEKHFSKHDYMARRGINKEFIHRFAQVQAIYLHTCHLNQLLCRPVNIPSPRMLFNGTFDYNICHLLENNVEPKNILGGEESALNILLQKWKKTVERLIGQMS